jgi:hypothetical protein
MGATVFTVNCYASGEFLRLVFNGIASIFGDASYLVAMNIAALLGFVAILTRSAFDRTALHNFRWFIVMIFFYMAAIVPKVSVRVNDRILPGDSATVDNVPIGLAATAGVFSEIGDWLARSFEQAFSLPYGAVEYSGNGLLFAHRLLAALQSTSLPEGTTKNNFVEFFKSCVVLDGIGQHRFTWEDVRRSTDLMTFFSERTAQHAAFFSYSDGSASALLPCRDGFRDHVRPDIEAMEEDLLRQSSLPLLGTLHDLGRARNSMSDNIADAVDYLTGVTSTSTDLVMQHALLNALDNARMSMAQELGASALMQGYALSKAELERKTTYQAMGKIASDKLPLLKNLFEAFLYAIFPIIALMAIVMPTKVSFAYAKALLWINLWAPAYALLHFAATFHSNLVMPDIASLYSGMTAAAQGPLLQHNADVVATVGYLALSIPMIAWLLVSQSGAMAAHFAGRVLEGYDRSVGSAAGEAAAGNMEMMGQRYRFTAEGMLQQSHNNMYGQEVTRHADGTQTFRNPQSELQIRASAADSIVESTSEAVASARSVQSQATLARANANLQTVSIIDAVNSALRDTDSVRSGTQTTFAAGTETQFSQREKLIQNASEATGLSHDDVKEAMGQIRASAGGGANVLVARAGVEAGVGGSWRRGTRESESVKRVADYLASSDVGFDLTSSARQAINNANSHGTEHSESHLKELRQAMNTQRRAEGAHVTATSDVLRAEERHVRAKELRHDFATNETDAFVSFAAEYRPKQGDQAVPGTLPSEMTPQQVAQLVNRAARGDDAAQSELSFLQMKYLDARVDSPTMDAGKKSFDEKWASARGEIAASDVYGPQLQDDIGPAENRIRALRDRVIVGRESVQETIRMADDGLQEAEELTSEQAAALAKDVNRKLE